MTLYYYLSDRFAPCLRNKIEYSHSTEGDPNSKRKPYTIY